MMMWKTTGMSADAIAYIVYDVLCIGFKMIYIKQQFT